MNIYKKLFGKDTERNQGILQMVVLSCEWSLYSDKRSQYLHEQYFSIG